MAMAGSIRRRRLKGRTAVLLLVFCAALGGAGPARAGEALVAVAANFQTTLLTLKADFEVRTPHRLQVSTGSTGKLYAQIVNGAPYDVFLSADQDRPARLEAEGYGIVDSRFSYAFGQLVLWSPGLAGAGADDLDGPAVLREAAFRRIAIANPDLAPYGRAAMETLTALGLAEALRPKIVMGENIGQAFALIATGNTELGFVGAGMVPGGGPVWRVPDSLYRPIRQDAVLLNHGKDNSAAQAFLAYLRGADARSLITAAGYLPRWDRE